jgi:hypothetical protein
VSEATVNAVAAGHIITDVHAYALAESLLCYVIASCHTIGSYVELVKDARTLMGHFSLM